MNPQGSVGKWVLDPPKHPRVDASLAANVRWINQQTGTERYEPRGVNPNESKRTLKEVETQKRWAAAEVEPKHQQFVDKALTSLAKLNAEDATLNDAKSMFKQLTRMEAGARKAMIGRLMEAGVNVSETRPNRKAVAQHIMQAVLDRSRASANRRPNRRRRCGRS